MFEESLDIMRWALAQQDRDGWLQHDDAALIAEIDGDFKRALDQYKYAEDYGANGKGAKGQAQGCGRGLSAKLEARLQLHAYLCSTACSITDIAIFPFIRQFAAVDEEWFQAGRLTLRSGSGLTGWWSRNYSPL